jgi:hypothetical protein
MSGERRPDMAQDKRNHVAMSNKRNMENLREFAIREIAIWKFNICGMK